MIESSKTAPVQWLHGNLPNTHGWTRSWAPHCSTLPTFFHFDEVMKCGTGAVTVGVQLRLESFKHR